MCSSSSSSCHTTFNCTTLPSGPNFANHGINERCEYYCLDQYRIKMSWCRMLMEYKEKFVHNHKIVYPSLVAWRYTSTLRTGIPWCLQNSIVWILWKGFEMLQGMVLSFHRSNIYHLIWKIVLEDIADTSSRRRRKIVTTLIQLPTKEC